MSMHYSIMNKMMTNIDVFGPHMELVVFGDQDGQFVITIHHYWASEWLCYFHNEGPQP